MGELVSKAEFARRVERSPGRISQWLAEEKIVETDDGRIDVDDALARLGTTLDPSQQVSQDRPIGATNAQEDYAVARAESAKVKAIRDRADLLAAQGVYMRTAEVERAWQRGIAQLLQQIESSFALIGKQLAAEMGADPRTVTVLLMRLWREARAGIETVAIGKRDEESKTQPAPELVS